MDDDNGESAEEDATTGEGKGESEAERLTRSCQRETWCSFQRQAETRMWANAQRDGRPAEYRWRPLFNAAKFG